MKKITSLFVLIFLSIILNSQSISPNDSVKTQADNVPTGWKFGGALPAVAYDTDVGFRYGALGNVYDWGDGSQYPDYVRSIYAEWSQTTKGSGVTRFAYDDKNFFNTNLRFTSEIGYYKEQNLDFYGFNGYQSVINYDWMDTENPEYKSRMFYRLERKTFRGVFDIQIPVSKVFKIYTGVSIFQNNIASVDIAKLNKNKPADQLLPTIESMPGLFEKYQQWNIISSSDKNGGFITLFKAGLIFDTRNNEALPTKGLWDELIVLGNPGFGGTSKYLQLYFTHRQYFSIIKDRLSFAYRLIYMGKIAGEVPFYMLPYYYNTKDIQDGIGSSKTVRGILRDRVVANSSVLGNAEIRWKVYKTKFGKQNFYVALSGFADATRIIVPYEVNLTSVPLAEKDLYFNTNEKEIYNIHLSYGGGLRLVLNENFIVAVDYGMANTKQDGTTGLYIGLGWLF
jgi:hypothetical protein